MATGTTGFSRMAVDERRQALLEIGRALFSARRYDELSMAMIAREAGISKALLYHYFPSKRAFFMATMQDSARSLGERVRPDPDDPPREQLRTAVDAWLGWVDEHREGYGEVLQGASAAAEVREIVAEIREAAAGLILERLLDGQEETPEVRAAVCGWLSFIDGVCLDWVRHDRPDRAAVHALLSGALPGALRAAGHEDLAARLD